MAHGNPLGHLVGGGLGRPWTSYGITWASLWAPLGSWGVSYLILLQADLRQFGVWKRLCDGFGSIVSELMLLGSLLEPLGSLGRLMGTLLVISWEGASAVLVSGVLLGASWTLLLLPFACGSLPAAQPGLSPEPHVPFAAAPPRPTASVPLWYP